LTKEAQDLAKPNDFEFFTVPWGQELVPVSLHCKEDGLSVGKSKKRNERDIERALGSRGTFLSRAGVRPHTSQLSWFIFFNEFSSQAFQELLSGSATHITMELIRILLGVV
jgi:hypothetical protein